MLSERVVRILRAKTGLRDDEIDALSEAEAWNLIYSLSPAKAVRDRRKEACVTGFRGSDRESVPLQVEALGFKIVSKVTKNCSVLVCGSNAGPAKMEKAAKQGTAILSLNELVRLTETGEIPSRS